jgi:hypothetical protein
MCNSGKGETIKVDQWVLSSEKILSAVAQYGDNK